MRPTREGRIPGTELPDWLLALASLAFLIGFFVSASSTHEFSGVVVLTFGGTIATFLAYLVVHGLTAEGPVATPEQRYLRLILLVIVAAVLGAFFVFARKESTEREGAAQSATDCINDPSAYNPACY